MNQKNNHCNGAMKATCVDINQSLFTKKNYMINFIYIYFKCKMKHSLRNLKLVDKFYI